MRRDPFVSGLFIRRSRRSERLEAVPPIVCEQSRHTAWCLHGQQMTLHIARVQSWNFILSLIASRTTLRHSSTCRSASCTSRTFSFVTLSTCGRMAWRSPRLQQFSRRGSRAAAVIMRPNTATSTAIFSAMFRLRFFVRVCFSRV